MSGPALTIPPRLESIVFCTNVKADPTGRLTFENVFHAIEARQRRSTSGEPPVAPFRFFLCTAWVKGVGRFDLRLEMVSPDGTRHVLRNASFALSKPAEVAPLYGSLEVEFVESGPYQFVISLNGVEAYRKVMLVSVIPRR